MPTKPYFKTALRYLEGLKGESRKVGGCGRVCCEHRASASSVDSHLSPLLLLQRVFRTAQRVIEGELPGAGEGDEEAAAAAEAADGEVQGKANAKQQQRAHLIARLIAE